MIRGVSFRYICGKGPRLGMIVSKRYGNSVQRSLFKRRCRSLFKELILDFDSKICIIVQPIKGRCTFSEIRDAFEGFCGQVNV